MSHMLYSYGDLAFYQLRDASIAQKVEYRAVCNAGQSTAHVDDLSNIVPLSVTVNLYLHGN